MRFANVLAAAALFLFAWGASAQTAGAGFISAPGKALVAGDSNPVYDEALTAIAAADAGDNLANLYAEARRTQTGADEAIVGKLQGIDGKISRTEAEIADLRRTALDLSRRRLEMEQVRERFRRTGYDHPQSTFDNDGDIGNVLKNILEGAVRSGVLWDLLRRGHRSRPNRSPLRPAGCRRPAGPSGPA